MKNTAGAPWVRLGLLGILALILGLSTSMPLPLKLVGVALLVLNLVVTLVRWRDARRRRAEQRPVHQDSESS
jgi:membrane protein implicated in regulation of membrane protease activity